ncbi:hypothetical protein Tco_1039121 [Tanacetum coccineum]
MLKKFGLEDSKRMKTPMSSDTKLTKDEECKSVDSTKYRGMIGDIVKSVSTAVHSRIAGVSSVAGNMIAIEHIFPLQVLVDDPLNQLP